MTRLIKRYGNRKLYDTRASRYVTLDGIAELVRRGEDVRIVDNASGDDLTISTFAQIIFEEAKRKNGALGLPVLQRLIRLGGERVQELLLGGERRPEHPGTTREAAGRAPAGRAERSPADAPGPHGLLDELLQTSQRQLEQLQQRLEAQVRASLERVAGHPAFQAELQRLERSVRSLERQLARLRRQTNPPPTARRRRRAAPARSGRPAGSASRRRPRPALRRAGQASM